MSASVPLLRSSSVTSRRRRCSSCPFSYHFQFIRSRGAILVLIWDLMIGISVNLLIQAATSYSLFNAIVLEGLGLIALLAGFFGDFLISRYKLVLVGTCVSFLLLIPLTVIITFQLPTHLLLIFQILCILSVFAIQVVRINLIPFNIDQLIGSSSDELTAVIHWHNLGSVVAIFFDEMIGRERNNSLVSLLDFSGCIICIAAILVSHNLFNHYLETTPVNTSNPIKLIVKVLCYARKHKYPENRSALTYWEEEAPSRLDLGMEKYGGPFTEEQVEDVKTVLRLLPIILVCSVGSGFYGEIFMNDISGVYYGCQNTFNGNISVAVAYLFILLLHQFLIYPCFYKYIPSMLKRIGLGMVLVLIVNIIHTILAFIGNYHIGEMFHCLTAYDEKSFAGKHHWIIFNDITVAVNWYITYVVLVEFILAQCPKSVRGTMMGLWLCFRILRSRFQLLLFLPFLHFMASNFPFGRGFYFCLTVTIISVFLLLIFIFLAKRYKFRIREVEINIHRIAENHIINNIEQDERLRSCVTEPSSIPSVVIIEES